jgi:hypothetical protein
MPAGKSGSPKSLLTGRSIVLAVVILGLAVAAIVLWRVSADYGAAAAQAQRGAQILSLRTNPLIVHAEVLAAQCDDYADSHGGQYPPDVAVFRDWLFGNGMNVPDDLDAYIYVGRGITRANSDGRIALWFRKPTTPGEKWLVVLKTMSDAGRTKLVSDNELAVQVQSANDARTTLGLQRVGVQPESRAADTQSASRPDRN